MRGKNLSDKEIIAIAQLELLDNIAQERSLKYQEFQSQQFAEFSRTEILLFRNSAGRSSEINSMEK